MKYSFSEAKDRKSVTVIELAEKGKVSYKTIDLVPQHDLVELKGTYDELTFRSFYEGTTWPEDYTHITLTDEEDIPDAIGKLRTVYHRLMKLDYDNRRTRSSVEILGKNGCLYSLIEDHSHGGVRTSKGYTDNMLIDSCRMVVDFIASKYPGQIEEVKRLSA